jgi:hypothetical protein
VFKETVPRINLRWQSLLKKFLFESSEIGFKKFAGAVVMASCLVARIDFTPQYTPARDISQTKLCAAKMMKRGSGCVVTGVGTTGW